MEISAEDTKCYAKTDVLFYTQMRVEYKRKKTMASDDRISREYLV